MADDYFIGVHARELERLRDQHAAWLPESEALWKAAGFHAGQHLADLGCGPGYSTFGLARIAGPSGHVTALDRASPFLDYLANEAATRGLGNITTVEADITATDALAAPLDGAFCRFFLAFLIADLDRVLRTVYRSLKPGGTFAAMEYLTLRSATASPPLRGFDAHTRAWETYYGKNGGDTGVGQYLPSRLVNAGFEIASLECVGGMAQPSDRWWGWWGRLVADFGDKLAAEGYMTRDELEMLRTDWAAASGTPDAFIYTPILLQVVARKV
ncbi:MAG TPA: methyltransferase domain-containing protein [Burkholderiales bacterium]|nr:methyltransferase domain-containing protein [Burkholderiales bacterium]